MLRLSPRFAALDLAKQRAVSDVILSVIQTHMERVRRGLGLITEEEVRGVIGVEVERLGL